MNMKKNKTDKEGIENKMDINVSDVHTNNPEIEVLNTNGDDADLHETSPEDTSATEGTVNTEELLLENSKLKAELDASKDTLLRRIAEFENIKKRLSRERIQLMDDAKVESIKQFLPVNDDLQRMLSASTVQDVPEAFLEGVRLVAEKFMHVLESYGVEIVQESGVPFDVHIHDAMMKMPAPDNSIEPNTVLQVLEAGYKVKEKVIRHAKVIVSE